jgi:hypothetical protein
MSIVTSDTSPADLLTSARGLVTYAHVTSSRRIRLLFTDPAGGKWGLKSWEADYSPSVDDKPEGKTITGAGLDDGSGVLTVMFSDDTYFTLTPTREVEEESIEDWELFTPHALVLSYGPRGRWQLGGTAEP